MGNIKLSRNMLKIISGIVLFMLVIIIVLVIFIDQDTSMVSKMSDKEVRALKDEILAQKDIYLTVGEEGCEFRTVTEAIAAANDRRSTIYILDEVHTEANIVVNNDVIIRGIGANQTILQAADNPESADGRVVFVEEDSTVRLEGLTIRHGRIVDVPRGGGGILNKGTLTIQDCTIRDNIATYGVGIDNEGRLNMENCIIVGNRAKPRPVRDTLRGIDCRGSGAGIKIERDGYALLSNCLIMDNISVSNGGGIHVSCQGRAELVNCTIAKNTTRRRGGGVCVVGDIKLVHCTITENKSLRSDGSGVFAMGKIDMVANIIAGNGFGDFVLGSGSGYYGKGIIERNEYNFIGDGKFQSFLSGDAKLLPLADNGGATMTYAIEKNSPAVDTISAEISFAKTDQRGISRLKQPSDIGSYER